MDCQDGAGAGAGENPPKVASETKSIKPTWVFVEKESVDDLREQILQLTGHACHEEEEILRADLLEKLNRCKRDTLIELCRSFDVIGSRANRKEELVSFLMEFVKDHNCGIDGTNSEKKIKKRRRMKEEESLSNGKPSKKKKREGEEEADGRNSLEDRAKYSDCDLMDNRYIYADNKKGNFPKEQTNLGPSEKTNGCVSEKFDGVSLSKLPNTDEQAMVTTPSKKLIRFADGDSTDVNAFNKKSSVAKKKGTPKEDRKVKSCGKQESNGDTKPRKQAMKPSKDELREAVFLILDTADFATMTFGDVVKEVDKYFGKDLFERKPLIRSLIEEELFRLTEEAEKKELEEEEVAEAKARAEQAVKEMTQVRTVESDINERNVLTAGPDGKIKDSSKDTNDSTNEESINGGASVESAVERNNSTAAEASQDHNKADADAQNGDIRDEVTKNGEGEKVTPIANTDSAVQGSSNDEAETMKNNNVQTLEGSKNDRVKGASGENDVTEDSRNEGRSGNVGSNAEAANGCEAEESNNRANDEHVEHEEDGKAQEAHNNENSINVEIHGDIDGRAKEGDINAEQSQSDAGRNGKAEDVDEHSANTKVDVDSGNSGAAENGQTDGDVKGNSDTAEESPM